VSKLKVIELIVSVGNAIFTTIKAIVKLVIHLDKREKPSTA